MEELIIHTLGEFKICYGDKTVDERAKRSRKTWTLLEYLITFHDREVSQNELIELLWPEGESSNPAGALKTQLYRLRTALSEAGLPGDEIIVNSAGTYAFNNKLNFQLDCELFEQYVKESAASYSEKEKLACYMKAIDLYKGDYLSNWSSEQWVLPVSAYYHSMYVRTVHAALEILYSFRRYREMIDICRRAVVIERLDEKIHEYLMRALAESGDRQGAKSHYLNVLDMLYNREGINPSQEFVALYSEIVKSENEYGVDVTAVRLEMEEKDNESGAFYCAYDAFKHIYQLELRESRRDGKPVYLCVITAYSDDSEEITPKQQNKAMTKLEKVISGCLRSSDVFARYSATQFVTVFPGASDKICEKIMRRIVRHYKREAPKSHILLMFSYERADKPGEKE